MFTLMDRVSQDAIYHSSVQKNHKILIVRYLKRIKVKKRFQFGKSIQGFF